MNHVLSLQSLDVTFIDGDNPLSEVTCAATQSHTSVSCSTSSQMCDVAGEHYF